MPLAQCLLAIIAAFVFMIIAIATGHAQDTRPNILIIQADDLSLTAPTPSIDTIAAQGVRITEMHGAPMCSPARTDLLTSRYHERFGMNNALAWNAQTGIGNVPSMPKFFAEHGYETALFGKWHLGKLAQYSPLNHYQTFHGTIAEQIDQFTHRNTGNEIDWWNGTTRDTTVEYSTTAITSYALAYMAQPHAGPWFMSVAYTAVHVPNQAPDHTISYPKQLAYFDQQAATLMSAAPSNTIIVFVGDNGQGGTGLHGNKGGIYEGGLRIPAFIRWDGHLAPATIARVSSLRDIAPTLAELVGTPLTIPSDGVSFASAVLGQPWPPVRDLYFSDPAGQAFAEMRNPWKLIVNGTTQLYHIMDDPGETRNVASSQPAVVAGMRANIAAWRQQVGR